MRGVVDADASARSPMEELVGQGAVGVAAALIVFGGTAGVPAA